jgi:hypothetical protein
VPTETPTKECKPGDDNCDGRCERGESCCAEWDENCNGKCEGNEECDGEGEADDDTGGSICGEKSRPACEAGNQRRADQGAGGEPAGSWFNPLWHPSGAPAVGRG